MIRFRALSTILLGMGLSFAAHAKDRNVLQNFQVLDQADTLRVVFGLKDQGEYNLFKLDNPDRVVIDFKNTALGRDTLLWFDRQGGVKAMRHDVKDDYLRIVFDVDSDVNANAFVRRANDGSSRVMVDLIGALANPASPQPVTIPAKASKPVAEVRSAAVEAAVLEVMSESVASTAEAILQRPALAGKLRDIVIAVDAGHGGKDPGAIGRKYKTQEKDIVLSVAKKLAAALNAEPGFKAVLTRDKDVFLPLRDRIRRAKQANADLFISIHADAAENTAATGSSVFVLSSNGASSEAAKLLAKRENEADLLAGVNLSDKDDTLAHVLIDLTQRHTIDMSQEVASDILSKLSKVGDVHGKRVEKAGFVVLKSPDIPSVLVETAFISNAGEEKRMRTAEYQDKVANAVLHGVKQHFYEHADDDTLVAAMRKREHTIRSGETLSGIAMRYRVSTNSIKRANNLNSDLVRVGQKLRIPYSEEG